MNMAMSFRTSAKSLERNKNELLEQEECESVWILDAYLHFLASESSLLLEHKHHLYPENELMFQKSLLGSDSPFLPGKDNSSQHAGSICKQHLNAYKKKNT